jgi:hypothetical protein
MIFDIWVIGFCTNGRLVMYMSCSQSVVICDINFIHVNIFNLLIKVSLIFIKYLINNMKCEIIKLGSVFWQSV